MTELYIDVHDMVRKHPPIVNIDGVLKKYSNSTHVGQLCCKTRDGSWANAPAEVFYTPNPNRSLGHTNYFAFVYQGDVLYITGGDSAVSPIIDAIETPNGQIIYSAYRHDYFTSTEGNFFIDGGREYIRHSSGDVIQLQLKVIEGRFNKLI